MTVAVAQTCPVAGDVAANVAEHVRLVEIAAEAAAQIVVFPELSLTGYELDVARELAFAEDDARLLPLTDAAAASGAKLIVGAPVRIGERLHIGAFVLSPGRTIAIYTKHHLGAFSPAAACDGIVPPAEATVFDAGDSNPLIELDGGTAAVAVCADIGHASHGQRAAERGASAYLASMFVIPSEFAGDAAKLRDHATRHRMVVALANYGCASGGLAAAGRSSIWAETGELIAQLPASGSGVAVATHTAAGWSARLAMDEERGPLTA